MKNLVTISGSTCVGKNSVVKYLLSSLDLHCRETISFTTREKRGGEVDGIDYHFITMKEFQKLNSDGRVLEYNHYDENYYGTLKSEVASRNCELIILVIDVNGVESIKEKLSGDVSTIFFVPPGSDINAQIEVLRRRITNRGMNDITSIKKRMEIARAELKQKDFFDKIIINDVLEEAQIETLGYLKSIFPQCINWTQATQ